MSGTGPVDKHLDHGREGEREGGATAKVASEAVSEDPQAQPTTKFTTFSGTSDKPLYATRAGEASGRAASEFVIVDKSRGTELTSKGERSTSNEGPAAPAPTASFMDGLKKYVEAAKTPEEAQALQSAFSVEYIMRKAQELLSATQSMFQPAGADKSPRLHPSANESLPAGVSGDTSGSKVRFVSADETVRALRDDSSREVIASTDNDDVMFLFHKMEQDRIRKENEARTAPQLSEKALGCAANSLHEAVSSNFFGIATPDVKKILNTIDPMTEGDRDAVLKAYQKTFGEDFRVAAAGKVGPLELLQVNAVMGRGAQKADDLASIEMSLQRLSGLGSGEAQMMTQTAAKYGPGGRLDNFEEQSRRMFAEKQLRETLGAMSPPELASLKSAYDTKHRKDDDPNSRTLKSALLSDERISPATKEALSVYLAAGSSLKDSDVQALAEIGLKYKRADIFEEAFLNASDKLRAAYGSDGKQRQIDEQFGTEARIAKDYVQKGKVSVATLIRGDEHWFHTDKAHISSLLEHVTSGESAAYLAAMQSNDLKNPAYAPLHDALVVAAQSPRELAMWQGQLTRGGGLIVQLAGLHDDGLVVFKTGLRINEHHDFNKMLQAVNEMSPQEWTRLHNDESYYRQLVGALDSFVKNSGDRNENDDLVYLIDSKRNARSYEESKNISPESLKIAYAKPKDETHAEAHNDLPAATPAAVIAKAFVDGQHHVTPQDLRELLTDPKGNISALKNDFASKYGVDLSSAVLAKVDPNDRLEFLRLLTPGARNPRQELYDQSYQNNEQASPLADPLLADTYSSSKIAAEHSLNNLYGYVQAQAPFIESMSPAQLKEFQNRLLDVDHSQEFYVGSKRQFSEDFVNYSVGAAALGGAAFTGGGSWQLYAGMMAAGGAYKAASKSVIEGGSYKNDPASVLKDVGSGGIGTLTSVIGPEIFGVWKLAGGATARTLMSTGTRELFGQVTETELSVALSDASRRIMAHGSAGVEAVAKAEVAAIAKRFASAGNEAAAAEAIEATLGKNLLLGSSNLLKRNMYEFAINSAAGGAGGAINSFSETAFNGDYRKFANNSIKGFIDGAAAASVLQGLFHGVVWLKRVGNEKVAVMELGGQEISSKDGFTWQSADGKTNITGALMRTPGENTQIRTAHGDFVVSSETGETIFVRKDGSILQVGPRGEVNAATCEGSEHNSVEHTVANTSAESLRRPVEIPASLNPVFNLKPNQTLLYAGKTWSVDEISRGVVILSRSAESRMTRGDLGVLPSYKDSERIDSLRVGGEVQRFPGKFMTIERIEGTPPHETFVLKEDAGIKMRVTASELSFEHKDAVSATAAQLMDPHGDKKVESLLRGKLLLDETKYFGSEGIPDSMKKERYQGECTDPISGKTVNVVFSPITRNVQSEIRLQNEVRAQFFVKELGFDTGFPPSTIREVIVKGQKRLGLLQEIQGISLESALPEVIGKKLYGAGIDRASLTTEEMTLFFNPELQPDALLNSLRQKAMGGQSGPAADRFYKLISNPQAMKQLRADPSVRLFRERLEQAIVERHVLGDFDDHSLNFVIDSADDYRVKNIDVELALQERPVPRLDRKKVALLTDDLFTILSNAKLSENTVNCLHRFIRDPQTTERLRRIGFGTGDIEGMMSRARFYAEGKHFPEVTDRD